LEQGFFILLLHAHLPYVRHPEHEIFLEEDWFFEALTETYLPLLFLFENWKRDQIHFRLTLSMTPTLLAMLEDPLLLKRYRRHLKTMGELSEKEIKRNAGEPAFRDVALGYRDHFRRCEKSCFDRYGGNLIEAFARFQNRGNVEIVTSAATHGYLPLLNVSPESVRAQIRTAVDDYQCHFKRPPRGIWLPECGYYPGLDGILNDHGIEFFFLDAHALLFGTPRPTFGNFAPVRCPSGTFAFARDIETSKLVWSKEHGYPGDPYYREFYRDIGMELDPDYLGPCLNPDGSRKNTGIKYHRITDRHSPLKMVYEPEIAKQRAEAHASHFLSGRISQVRELHPRLHRPPLIVSTYDAELFGHWWFEGPLWLDFLFRKMDFDQSTIRPVTPSEYLSRFPVNQTITPAQSSWGDRGYHEFWLNDSNHWIYPHLHEASFRMSRLAARYPESTGILKRALDQAARELLLAQASDWAFIMRTGTTVDYANKRFREHIARFMKLDHDIRHDSIDPQWLDEVEWRDRIFPHADYRCFKPESRPAPVTVRSGRPEVFPPHGGQEHERE
jgi:1,4-alpha-glucan branching enzyme